MTPERLLLALQFSDTLFPTGGFAYSDGLETAAANGGITTPADLQTWLAHYIEHVFPSFDGRAVRQAMEAGNDWKTIRRLDQEVTAMKPSSEGRASSVSMGKGFLKSVVAVRDHPDFQQFASEVKAGTLAGNFAVVYGVTVSRLGFDTGEALLSFAYTRLSGMISAAQRLLPIGQQAAQKELHEVLKRVPPAVERVMNDVSVSLESFAPLLDIQQMNHRYAYSRLFRS